MFNSTSDQPNENDEIVHVSTAHRNLGVSGSLERSPMQQSAFRQPFTD